MPVWAGLANSSSDEDVEHGDFDVVVRQYELVACRWLVCTVASRLGVEALVLVSLAMVMTVEGGLGSDAAAQRHALTNLSPG